MIKILAIGNSFSEDATYYLKKIAQSAHVDVKVVNLYIGGCSLETHFHNIQNHIAGYRYELNGVYTEKFVSIQDTLQEEKWDIVTVQQVSGLTGVYESYGEYFTGVLECVKTYAPQAKIWFHQIWAYETDSTHPDYGHHNNSQEKMAQDIQTVTHRICRENGGMPMIPSGELVASLRRTPAFCYGEGGRSLCRDGFHMDLLYGRYAVGLLWYQTLLNGDISKVTFCPAPQDIVNGYECTDFPADCRLLELIKQTVKNFAG